MGDVLGGRPEHFGAHESAGAVLAVDPQKAAILADDPASALVFEVRRADREAAATALLGLLDAQSHRGDLRIGEHHGNRRAPTAGLYIRKASGVGAGDPPLVGGFVEQREFVVGIAGNEYGAVAAAKRIRVELGHAVIVEREARGLQGKAVDVRASTGCGQQVVERLAGLVSVFVAKTHLDAGVGFPHAGGLRVGVQRKLAIEAVQGNLSYLGVLDRTDRTADAEHSHANAQSRERLAQFQADNPGTENRDRTGQVGPVEYFVVGDQPATGTL